MGFKTLIFIGLIAVALGYILPEEHLDTSYVDSEWIYGDQIPEENNLILIRRARSPQRRFDARTDHSRRLGSSASFRYTQPISKNWEAYAGGSRNFKYNDNSGHAGLRLKF